MSELQQGIRACDSLIIQIKGWAVTVGLASAGLALTTDEPLAALLGIYAAITFWAVEAHRRALQHRMISRVMVLESALLRGFPAGLGPPLQVPYLAHSMMQVSFGQRVGGTGRTAILAGVWGLYVAMIVLLLAVALRLR